MVGQKLTKDELVETGNVIICTHFFIFCITYDPQRTSLIFFIPQVKFLTLVYFLKFVGVASCLFMLFSSLMFQSFSVGTNLWLSKWAGNPSATHSERNVYLIVYALLGLSQGTYKF